MVIKGRNWNEHYHSVLCLSLVNMAFEITSEHVSNNKKFKVQRKYIDFVIKPVPEDVIDPVKWIEDGMQSLIEHVFENVDPDARVGMTIEDKVNFRKAYMSFRKASTVSMDEVWKMVTDMYQSAGKEMETSAISLTLTQVLPPKL